MEKVYCDKAGTPLLQDVKETHDGLSQKREIQA